MKRILAVVGLAALAAAPAQAVDQGFYAGFDFGQYSYDLDTGGVAQQISDQLAGLGLATSNVRTDTSEDGFTYGVVVGYQVRPYLAVEAAYVDLGSAEYKFNATVSDGTTSSELRSQLTTDSSGPTLSALGILPFGKGWELYGRVGVYFASNEAALRLSADGIEESVSDDSSSQELLWGGGLGYTRGKYSVRLDYQQFTDVGDDSTGEASIDRLAVGAIFRF